jgi:hypothetical protein
MTLYPMGYGADMVTMTQLKARHLNHMEPEFARRLFNWIESKGGDVGIGGGYRPPGTQPNKPGFAPPGLSFHEGQIFADGTRWYSAVDLVHVNPGRIHRAPTVAECPQQGTAEALRWGVHINTSESWHMQAVPQDGYATWVALGRPRPRAGYPIPDLHPDTPSNMEDDMAALWTADDGSFNGSWFAVNGTSIGGIHDVDMAAWMHEHGLLETPTPVPVPASWIQGRLDNEGA